MSANMLVKLTPDDPEIAFKFGVKNTWRWMLVYFSILHVQFFLPFFLKNIQSFFGVSAGTDFSSLSGNRKKLVMRRFRGLDVANWWKHFIKKRFVISFIKSLPTLFFWLDCLHTHCKKFFSFMKVSSLQFLNHFTLNFPLRNKHNKLVKFYFENIYIYNFTAQWGSVTHQMVVPVPSISCCVS